MARCRVQDIVRDAWSGAWFQDRAARAQPFLINRLRLSANPLGEFLTVTELVRLYRAVKPDLVYRIAIKPILMDPEPLDLPAVHTGSARWV